MTKPTIDIKVVSDIMCPWCWVGKRNLETAMENSKNDYNFKVTWHPFLLRPNMPEDGVPKPENYGPGSGRLVNAGRSVGIDFTYKCDRFPNTVIAHCALEYALEQDPSGKIQNELQEALFRQYFTNGEYPDAESVSKLCGRVGLIESKAKEFITDVKNQQHVRTTAASYSRSGISEQNVWKDECGVPYFIFNDHGMFSGAQDPATISHSFKTIVEKFPFKSTI